MKTVYLHGQSIRLTKEIGAGQEAVVYDMGNGNVAKIYRQSNDPYYTQSPEEQQAAHVRISMHQKKLTMFPRGLESNIISPRELLTDKQGLVVGYTMPFITGAETLLTYGDIHYRESMNISNNEIRDIFVNLHKTLKSLHNHGIVIGDFNDLNTLIKNQQVYMIDTDSYQFGSFMSTMYTEKFVDPLICDIITKGKESFWTMTKNHNPLGDWYAFSALLFKTLLFVDPYGGIYKPKDSTKRIKQQLRAHHRINVFNPEVVYPKHAYPYNVLTDDMIHYFKNLFDKDNRGEFPIKLLEDMHWQRCPVCGLEYATSHCPICTVGVKIFAPVAVSGNVQMHEIFHTDGVILFVTLENNKLMYLYHQDNGYKRENSEIVMKGELDRGLHFAINDTTTIFGKSNTMLTHFADGKINKTFVDCVGNKSIFDANNQNMFWIENGTIYKGNPLGLEYSPSQIGQGVADQTLLWVGNTLGFGMYKAGNILQGFVFEMTSKVINDRVVLPFIKGQITDAKCFISDAIIWLMIATKDQSQYINHCIVIDRQGNVLAHIDNSIDNYSWLNHIKGKSAFANYLFCPTDEGILRISFNSSGKLESKLFVDTEQYVNEQSKLIVSTHGIYVVKRNKIILLAIK
ncbi:TPA: hypothetical protein DIC40_07530 [Patescibacteria group bacterium]|nr:hypothetical protein P148_SR1C00001G0813 [candidate division SR1 bacterium RAAC1_SR1_1]HCY21641.1 hypothetical protein [Candidatus Gracilibacteria bacterium]